MYHSQQYFNYIVVACFIRGGNRITREINPICRKPLANCIIMFYLVHLTITRIRTHNVSSDMH
jgi:hypothetical protein